MCEKEFWQLFYRPCPYVQGLQEAMMTDLENNGTAGSRGKMESVGVEGKQKAKKWVWWCFRDPVNHAVN